MFTDLNCLVSKISDYPLMFPAAPPDILSVDKAEEEEARGGCDCGCVVTVN